MNRAASISASGGHRSQQDRRPGALAAIFGRIVPAIEAAVGSQSPHLSRLHALQSRFDHDRLQLAVLGQFKRGKSTFINALLGADILPTGVVPLTAVATFIAWGPEPHVTVRFQGGAPAEEFGPQNAEEIRDVLFRFVAEEANPENRLGVERVDLLYPADILADGTVIIDTPGVGSTLRHNTEAALAVLPESDAAFFVVSADPPITEVELDYLHHLKSKTARVFFILNKADYLRSDDKDRVVKFLRWVLAEKSLIDAAGKIFCISALEGLDAKRTGDRQALDRSGVAGLEYHLLRTLAEEKARWLEDAVRGKAADILAQASAELDLSVRALKMPIEQLVAKADAFQEALRSIEEHQRITGVLLVGDHRRLGEALDARVASLREEIASKLARVIDASLSGALPKTWEEAARRDLSAAMQNEFDAAREPLVSAFAAEAGAALRGRQELVDALVDQVLRTAAEIFDVPLRLDTEHESFALGEDPYWVTENVGGTLIPDPSRLIDRLLPTALRRRRLRARMIRQAGELIVRNAENLRWAILRGLDETFRAARIGFEGRLIEAIAATRGVIKDALARRRDQSFAVQPELDRLSRAAASLASLRNELQAGK